MKTQFFLTGKEVNEALQGFVAKHYRSRSIKVTDFAASEKGEFVVNAEVVSGEPRKKAATKVTTAKRTVATAQ